MLRTIMLATALSCTPVLAQDGAETEGSETAAAATFVEFDTSMGAFVVELLPEKAPVSVQNFLAYVDDGFYDGTVFHRIIGSFVIQGGGYTPEFTKKPTREPITNEADNMEPNVKGTLAMARTADPHSATSQFYINVADNLALNHTGKTNSRAWGYAVFGRVVSGMDVIEAMRVVDTGPGGPFPRDVPREPIVVLKAEKVEAPVAPTPETVPEAASGDQ